MIRSAATNHRHASGRYQRQTLAGKRTNPVPYTTTTIITPRFEKPKQARIGTRKAPTLRTLGSVHRIDFGKGVRMYRVQHVSGNFLILRSVYAWTDRNRVDGEIRVNDYGATYVQTYPVHSKAHIVHTTVTRARTALTQPNPYYGGAA